MKKIIGSGVPELLVDVDKREVFTTGTDDLVRVLQILIPEAHIDGHQATKEVAI